MTTEQKTQFHTIKTYRIDPKFHTYHGGIMDHKFKAQVGNVQGIVNLPLDYIGIVIQHSSRWTEEIEYKIKLVFDGDQTNIEGYTYLGTIDKIPSLLHVYWTGNNNHYPTTLT